MCVVLQDGPLVWYYRTGETAAVDGGTQYR